MIVYAIDPEHPRPIEVFGLSIRKRYILKCHRKGWLPTAFCHRPAPIFLRVYQMVGIPLVQKEFSFWSWIFPENQVFISFPMLQRPALSLV